MAVRGCQCGNARSFSSFWHDWSLFWRSIEIDWKIGSQQSSESDYHAPPKGGPGAKAPRTVAKFHLFKRCKVLANESSFQKYQYFSCPKIYTFSKKKFDTVNIFDRNLCIFSNNYLKIFKFYETNPEKFSVNSLSWLRNLQWRRKEFFGGNARAT